MKKTLLQPDDILKFILPSSPQISPDGEEIVFSRKHFEEKFKAVSSLWLVRTKSQACRQFTNGGSDFHPRWSPDGASIAFIRRTERARPQIFLVALTGGEAIPISKLPEGDIGDFKWAPNGNCIAFTFREADPDFTEEAREKRQKEGRSTPPRITEDAYYRLDGDGYFGKRKYDIFILDAASKNHKPVFNRAKISCASFDWSPDSRELLIAADLGEDPLLQPWNSRLYRLDLKTGKLSSLPGQKDGLRTLAAWSPDGRKIAFTAIMGKQETFRPKNQILFITDVKTDRTQNLTGKEDFCLEGLVISDIADVSFNPVIRWAPDSRQIFMELGWHGDRQVASIPISGGKIKFETSESALILLGNVSENGKLFALNVNNASKLPEIAVGMVKNGKMDVVPLTVFNEPYLQSIAISKPETTWIQTEESSRIQVWSMKPPSFKAGRKYPAILEIHGGPHCQYGNGFFNEFQLLASHGFVVFFCNPRGSKGYGEAFCECISGDWGKKDWDDIKAVINFIGNQPFVDREKMGIIGGSYGGYMTNWAIGHTDEFAAAVSDRACGNLVSLVGNSDCPTPPDSYWPGSPWDRPDELWNQSPIKYFDRVKTPTLIVHSEGDLRCNVEQGEQVFNALKLRGIPTRFVRYPVETSHGMSRSGPPDLRIHRLEEILGWFKKYLRP